MSEQATEDGAAEERPLRSDRVYGAVAVVALLLSLFFLLRGCMGGGGDDGGGAEDPPRLTLLQPQPGDTVGSTVAVVFGSEAPLRQLADGWGAGGLHLHLRVDGAERMPTPSEIRPAGGGRYEWVLAGLDPGEHTLQLAWSDAAHRPLAGGASRQARVTVR